MKADLVVVGAGLFGSVAAALARARGLKVLVVDDARKGAASRCSACLFKPSWLGSLSREERETAYAVLGELYGVEQVALQTQVPGVQLTLDWVPPARILRPPDRKGTVLDVTRSGVQIGNGLIEAGAVLLAAGVWGRELAPSMPEVRALAGLSVRSEGAVKPSFRVWAPYKQAILFNVEKDVAWFGDGSAILKEHWTPEREAQTVQRAVRAGLGRKERVMETRLGYRPRVEGHPAGYFERVRRGLYVSNGGAKNGTVLAALQAAMLMKELGI